MPVKNNKINPKLSDSNKSFHEQIDEVRSLVEENIRYTKNLRQEAQKNELVSQKELQKLLQENLKISKDLYEMTTKINKWIVWQRVWGVVKLLIIIIPIALGIIYLPPLIEQAVEPYQNILDTPSQGLERFFGNNDQEQAQE